MQVAGRTNETTTGDLAVPRTADVLEYFRRHDRDGMLLAAIAGGDREAFRQFYERHSDKVALALRQLCRGNLPEDLFQEVFMAVWRKAGTFDPQRGDVGGWLFTICRNKVYDQYRRSRPPEVELLESDSPQFFPTALYACHCRPQWMICGRSNRMLCAWSISAALPTIRRQPNSTCRWGH